jgi:uncharacterized protein (DUF1810 family)
MARIMLRVFLARLRQIMSGTTSTPTDPFQLERFVAAQEGIYEQALAELQQGKKRSHWMWFIFPQIAGLGSSSTAQFYAINGAEEARAYLAHPVLGPRLLACAAALLPHSGRSASEIFGYPDDLKLRSSLTLFAAVNDEQAVFKQLLEQFYAGQPDPATLERLQN